MRRGNILIDVLICVTILIMISMLVLALSKVEYKNKINIISYSKKNEEKIRNAYILCKCDMNNE